MTATAKKATAKKATPRKRTAAAVEASSPEPPLDAIATPVKRRTKPRKESTAGHRRGATAPPTPDELVKLRERERTAVELAAAGITDWDKIAELAGYSDRSAAWKAVQRVLDRQEFAAVGDYRRLIGYRLERLIRANWEAAIKIEETPAKEKATNRVFRATEQLRRTFGLDLEVDKLADALRIPDTAAEREAELRRLTDGLKVVGGTDLGD